MTHLSSRRVSKPSSDERARAVHPPEKRKKILIVEDEFPVARVIQLKLSEKGFDVDVANDGKVGEEKVLKGGYSAILLDLVLPQKDGFEIIENIRKEVPEVKVIIMTNLGQAEDRKRVSPFDPDGYFVKSEIAIFDLVEEIALIVDK